MKNLIAIIIVILAFTQRNSAQNPQQEDFTSRFISNKDGGTILFCKDRKQIEINLFGKNIETAENADKENLPNHFFIGVDKMLIQATIISIPENVQKVYGTDSLTLDQQRRILLGYMGYEINYINRVEGPGAKDVNYAEGDVNLRKYIIWNYNYKNIEEETDTDIEQATGQFCLSTVVFDKVLNISVTISKSTSNINQVAVLRKITENIELNKKECN